MRGIETCLAIQKLLEWSDSAWKHCSVEFGCGANEAEGSQERPTSDPTEALNLLATVSLLQRC